MDSSDSQEPLQTEAQPILSGAWNKERKRHTKMIKTRTGAQRYNNRMSKIFEEAMRLRKENEAKKQCEEANKKVLEAFIMIAQKNNNINEITDKLAQAMGILTQYR